MLLHIFIIKSAREKCFSDCHKSLKTFPIYLLKKNPCVSGPSSSNPCCFKGQLVVTKEVQRLIINLIVLATLT